MPAVEKQFAIGPDGRVVAFDPHHQTLKPGWRMATPFEPQGKRIDAALADEVIHESIVELTSE